MEITAKMVKALREVTGSGIMDCKKALMETDGDQEAAIEVLRKKGLATAEKKAGRTAAEGITYTLVEGNRAVAVEVNSETDFVAKNEKFQAFVDGVAKSILASGAKTVEELEDKAWFDDTSTTVKEVTVNRISTIGENLKIRRFATLTAENGVVVPYVHAGGRIGVLVQADTTATDNADVQEALKNVAMQIAALNAQYISQADISEEEKAKLFDITVESSLNDPASLPKPILMKLIDQAVSEKLWSDEDIAIYEEKKNNMNFLFNFLSKEAAAKLSELALADKANIAGDKIFSGMIQGRVSKQYKEICLMDQVYVKAEDGKQNVAKYLQEVSKAVGADVKVVKFVRFETGEGIEKKEENFAEEVAKQMQ